jgi:hypothetical protein
MVALTLINLYYGLIKLIIFIIFKSIELFNAVRENHILEVEAILKNNLQSNVINEQDKVKFIL